MDHERQRIQPLESDRHDTWNQFLKQTFNFFITVIWHARI